jgi:hypothetical protein
MGGERDVNSGVALREGYRFEDSDELARRNDVHILENRTSSRTNLINIAKPLA